MYCSDHMLLGALLHRAEVRKGSFHQVIPKSQMSATRPFDSSPHGSNFDSAQDDRWTVICPNFQFFAQDVSEQKNG